MDPDLQNPQNSDRHRLWLVGTALLILVHAVVVFATFRDYGITYDEQWQVRHGQNLLAWYTSGFTDRSFETDRNMKFYGGLFDLSAALLHSATEMELYEFRHLLNGLFAVLALAGVARLGARLGGPSTAFFATLILLTTPRFFGHGFNNCKDIPLAAGFVWALDALVALVSKLPRPGWRPIVAVGIWCGLALAVRMGAALLLGYLGLGLGLWWLDRWRQGGLPDSREARTALWKLCGIAAGVGLVAWLVMMPFWPYFHLNPVLNPLRALVQVSRGGMGTILVLHGGELLPHHDLPHTYVWSWLARALPEAYGLGLFLALLGGLTAWRRGEAHGSRLIGWVLVLFATFLPFLIATAVRPPVYDGIRHFLFAACLLAVPVGAGFTFLLRPEIPRVAKAVPLILLIIGTAVTVGDMIRLHPYQTTWFNRLVGGGLRGADGRFDTDYWGNSFKEGAEWLVANVRTDIVLPTVVSSCHPRQTAHYLPPNRLRYLGSVDHTPPFEKHPFENPPDYYLATTRWNRHRLYPGEVVYRVERDGVTLLVVVEVDKEAARGLAGSTPSLGSPTETPR